MPIGSDLNAVPPETTDSPTVAAARIIDTFDKLIEAVEGEVPVSALDVNDNLDMDGHHLDGVGFVGLEDQTADESTAGRLYRKGNDLYWVHPTGVLQLTDGTNVNASGIGGIGGDFGGGNPAFVEYDDTNERYEFYDDVGDFSGLMADRVVLKVGAGNCTHTTNTATDVTWTWPAAPAATGLMQATTGGTISVSPTVSYKVTFSTLPAHSDEEITVPLIPYLVSSGASSQGAGGYGSSSGALTAYFPIPGLVEGGRIKSVTARIARGAVAGTASLQLYYFAESGGVFALTAVGAASTSTATSQYVTLDQTGLTTSVVTNRQYFLRVDLPSTTGNGDVLGALTVTQDRT